MISPMRSRRDDAGASLIVTLMFIVIVSTFVGFLTPWMSNLLSNNVQFTQASAVQTDLGNAANLAIQSIRYTPLIASNQTLNASPPSYCWGATSPSSFSGESGTPVSTWCSTAWAPTSTSTRVVTIDACVSTTSATSCATNPQLQVVVTFDDYLPGDATTSNECTATCGEGITIDSWVWNSQ